MGGKTQIQREERQMGQPGKEKRLRFLSRLSFLKSSEYCVIKYHMIDLETMMRYREKVEILEVLILLTFYWS